ncbi:uncharacterized protein LOC127255838 [Andrographis paniculata]|uniref:uncharacterized protein LOC127255838 n=1 Tax=Andrographis paniculata TaxID=175694 RepID=UPI0021E87BD6|nr:uncharacterized protein LOC127255838 [Andrographis paniculata]
MGNCLTAKSDRDATARRRTPSATVVSDAGELRQFPLPVTAAHVFQSLSLSPESFFICNSDRLYFDEFIPSLDLADDLQPAQIYFLLPASRLQYPLAAADMAALAVKASAALERINGGRKRKARISPVLAAEEDPQSNHTVNYLVTSGAASGKPAAPAPAVSRSGSVRRLRSYSSRRARLAVRSFRMKLTTINEGSSFRLTS